MNDNSKIRFSLPYQRIVMVNRQIQLCSLFNERTHLGTRKPNMEIRLSCVPPREATSFIFAGMACNRFAQNGRALV